MKKFYLLVVSISLVLLFSLTFAQSQENTRQTDKFRDAKSIHKLELEKYKDYDQLKGLPSFEGEPRPLIPKQAAVNKEVFGYLPYWVFSSYPGLNYDLLTTIAYFGAEINGSGDIVNSHHWPAAGLIDKAHSEGVRVVLTVVLFDRTQLATLLSSTDNRTNLINNLISQVKSANADGVTIDFEGVPGSQKQNLTTFMTDLTNEFHAEIPGSFVTIFTPAVDWSDAFNYFDLAQNTDGLIMQGYDYHWSSGPTAGPVAPLTGWGQFNVNWTVQDYMNKTFANSSKLILSVPFYGFEWPTVDENAGAQTTATAKTLFYTNGYSNAAQYGRLWDTESQTPWYKYNDGQWHQGWYDDSLSLSFKFDLVNDADLKGIAIWALNYDGQRQELKGAISDAFGLTAPPLTPTHLRITNAGNGDVQVAVNSTNGATNYRVYTSQDGVNFDAGTDFPSASIILNNLSIDSTYYFKVSAINGNGESNLTEVLGVKPSNTTAKILVVNGFDRVTGTVNTFDFIKRFAPSITANGYRFDSCSNEAIEERQISLQDYAIVIWISGEEGTSTESFSDIEQQIVSGYLKNGGNLFISGSEIGYDLVARGTSSDKSFYQSYFKAEYLFDEIPVHTMSGESSKIFNGLQNLTFDNGDHGTYDVDFPDGIKPAGGSVLNMAYNGYDPSSFGGAGIQYEGTFGDGTVPGKLVYLAVPFETIYPASSRDNLMARILEFFDVPTNIPTFAGSNNKPERFKLHQNFPNPFNPSTTITFTLSENISSKVTLDIYNALGEKVVTLLNEKKAPGQYNIVWNGRNNQNDPLPSGIYFYQLKAGRNIQSKKMTLIR